MPQGLNPNVFDLLSQTDRSLGLMPLPWALRATPPLPRPPSLPGGKAPPGVTGPPGALGKPRRFVGTDPIAVIANNAHKFGLDPAAVLAYALEESGARYGAVGDNGTSFGPFQAHIGGAAGSRSPQAASAWANSPQGLIQMMGMMARGGARGLRGDAAVRAIYSGFGKGTPLAVPRGLARYSDAQHMLGTGSQPSAAPVNRNTATQVTTLFGNIRPRVIGVPYQGTHGKAFNVRGGSDNWESENAVDFSVPIGTPIYALADGTIGSQIGSLGTGGRFAGLRLHLVGAGNEWYYAHLSRLVVQAGQRVRRGQLLGYSGEANGVPHLHLASKRGSPPQ